MTRYAFKAIDFSASIVFLALCTKAFCTHFYQDLERHLQARKLPPIEEAPSLIPLDAIVITQLPTVPVRSATQHPRRPVSH